MHVRYGPAAALRAHLPPEQLPAVEQVILHGRAAGRVQPALQPGLRAAHGAGPRHARLDGLLGAPAARVRGAVAVLQSRAAPGQIELDQGGDAVAGTLPPLTAEHGRARVKVLVVRVMALRLRVTLEDGFPTNQTVVGVRGPEADPEDQDKHDPCQKGRALHQ